MCSCESNVVGNAHEIFIGLLSERAARAIVHAGAGRRFGPAKPRSPCAVMAPTNSLAGHDTGHNYHTGGELASGLVSRAGNPLSVARPSARSRPGPSATCTGPQCPLSAGRRLLRAVRLISDQPIGDYPAATLPRRCASTVDVDTATATTTAA